MINIKNLYKCYGQKTVLSNLSLDINKGEVLGIVGPNGVGKTTLFRILLGLESFDKGEILHGYKSIREVAGYLQTEHPFLPKITGREYIQLFADAKHREVDSIDKWNIFNLPIDDYIDYYSTGMKKKVALTAVLIQKNEIYVLDEPFNGLDFESCLLVYEIIKQLKEKGRIVIISSHILQTLQQSCDRIAHLSGGLIRNVYDKDQFDGLNQFLNMPIIKDGLRLDL